MPRCAPRGTASGWSRPNPRSISSILIRSRPTPPTRSAGPSFADRDEWTGDRWDRVDPVLHIEFRRWAELLVVAPLDANTLAKFALGLSDNFLTCLFRAWDFDRPIVLSPAMNTLMWDSPVTKRHFRQLLDDRGDGRQGNGWSLDDVDAVFARHAPRLVIVPPQAKRLACGDVGQGAMADVAAIVESVRASVNEATRSGHPG